MIPKFFLSFAVISILKSDNVAEAIKTNAEKLDALIDHEFGKKSEGIQAQIIESIFLPLAAELLKEDRKKFIEILLKEVERIKKVEAKSNPYL